MLARTVIIAVVAGAIGLVSGFAVGVREGVTQFFLLDSTARASLITFELQALRKDNVETIIEAKEIELDGEVVRATELLREGRPWIFWPSFEYERDHTRYLEKVASYRQEHPPVVPKVEHGPNSPIREEMEAFADNVKESTRQIISEYGD
jgi:hypothetical protein